MPAFCWSALWPHGARKKKKTTVGLEKGEVRWVQTTEQCDVDSSRGGGPCFNNNLSYTWYS